MLMKYKSPFDREDIFKEKVKILIKLDTFEIIKTDEEDVIRRLILLERIGCFRVLFILSQDADINKIVIDNDGEIISYYDGQTYAPMVRVKTNKATWDEDVICGKYEDFKDINPCNGMSKISVLDSILIDKLKIDYVVTYHNDIYFEKRSTNAKNIDSYTLIDEIRILLVNRGIYKKYTNSTVNQGLYYNHRVTSVFPYYTILRYYTNGLDGNKYKQVKEQTYSLAQRLIFLCKASDRISYYHLREANNDTMDECLYNFGYFVMLVTGIFDDFAWILSMLYSLDLRDMDIKLRCVYKNNEFLISKFMKKILDIDKDLYTALTNDNIQNNINILYPFRDMLQHREFITGMGRSKVVGGSIIKEDNMIVIPKGSIEFIMKSNIGNMKEWGIIFDDGEIYGINPHLFIERILYLINKISQCVVENIQWGKFLSEDELNKSKNSSELFINGKLVTRVFSNDTLYFGRIKL